jgi:pimeloyl-ACP methyl ester carboxylesterase
MEQPPLQFPPDVENPSYASAQLHGFHYSAHAHEVGSRPHIDVQSASRFEHSHESGSDLLVEFPVNLCLVPVFARLVLNPLEVADRDAAGVTQKVGNDEYASRVEDLVGFGRRRAVGCFGNDLRFHAGSVPRGQDTLESGGPVAAANRPDTAAVVSRGGRPDLAGADLSRVQAPVLFIVGGNDQPVITLNREAVAKMRCLTRLEIIEGATHLFEEPGALDQVSVLARDWFLQHRDRDRGKEGR